MRPVHETSVRLAGGSYRCGACPVSEKKGVCAWRIQNFRFDRVAVCLLVRLPQRVEQSCCFTLLLRLPKRSEFRVQPACSRESIGCASCFMKQVYKRILAPKGESSTYQLLLWGIYSLGIWLFDCNLDWNLELEGPFLRLWGEGKG